MNDIFLSFLLLGALSSSDILPFWIGTNQYGLLPEGSGGLALLRTGAEYDVTKDFQWKWGFSLAGQYNSRDYQENTADFSVIIDELYASTRWKVFTLDVGMKHVDIDFLGAGMQTLGSMSITGGHIVWAGNARTMPGYLITMDPVAVPFTHQVFWIHGACGDYKTLDNRYVQDALVHRTKFFLMFKVHPCLDIHLGLDHVAIWGGKHPKYGAMPISLENYFRVITGRGASTAGTLSDQYNVIGDQRGGLLFRVDWRGDGWKSTIQRDVPYDDGSGMLGLQNWPDGIYTAWFNFDNKDRWISDLVYEYHYTMKQSGTNHSRPTTDEEKQHLDPSDPYHYENHIYGGLDNYFNNSEYYSGWTYYGRTIGNPLLSPMGTHDRTWTGREMVLGIENNRVKAHHFSISGKVFHRIPYKLMITYSQNFGTYWAPYKGISQIGLPWGTVKETPLNQISAAFIGEFPLAIFSPLLPSLSALSRFTLTYGIYSDWGELLPHSFGATIGLRWDLRAMERSR